VLDWLITPVQAVPGNNGVLLYVHNDPLGTPQVLTDESGTTVWTASYDPFGKATVNEDPDGDGNAVTLNVRFPGQYYDKETGLHYNYFRYYDPDTGRYLTSDHIGINGGINTYAYVDENPLKYTDEEGLSGNSAHRQRARRSAPRPPIAPSTKNKGLFDDLPDGVRGLLCAAQFTEACLPANMFVCTRLHCTPKCGKPFDVDLPTKEPYITGPDTKCQCVQKGFNRNFNEPPPGL